MKKVALTMVAVILVFCSCNSCKPKGPEPTDLPYIIEVEQNFSNVKPVPLSSIGDKLEYIALETTPESLLAHATEIEMTESLVFVRGGDKLVEFDREGKYIRTIGKQGRGPGEYSQIWDFCVDETNGKIYFVDNFNLMVYGFDGEFVESVKLPFFSLYCLVKYPDRLFYSSPNIPYQTADTSFSWYETDLHGKNTLKYVSGYKKNVSLSGSPFYTFNKLVHFIEFGSDTLFYMPGSKPEPYALFRFGNLKMEADIPMSKPGVYDGPENKLLWLVRMDEDPGHLYITCNMGFRGPLFNSIFNKKTLETTFLENNGFVNDLDGGLPFWPKYIYNGSTLVNDVDALDLIKKINEIKSGNSAGNGPKLSEQLELLDKTLTENSNPVLVLLKQ